MSKAKGKTLSDKLAELANPTPQFVDPEDEYNEETKARLDRYEDDYKANDISATRKVLKNKTNLRQANAEILAASDSRYAGKRISRKQLEDSEEEDGSSEGVLDNETDEEDITAFNNKVKKTITKSSVGGRSETKHPSHSEASDMSENSDSQEEDEEMNEQSLNEEENEEFDGDTMDEEDGGSCEEEEASNEEDDDYVQSVDDDEEVDGDGTDKLPKNTVGDDIKKGKCIQNQISLWDHLLECRIKMHKGIHLSNQLPQGPSAFKAFATTTGDIHFATAAQGAQTAIKTMLDSCLELQDLLYKSNPQTKGLLKMSKGAQKEDSDEEIPSDTEEEKSEEEEDTESSGPLRKKMKVADYEKELNERHQSFRDFCSRTLHLWNEKTRLASGRVGAKSSGFGAFDQSILKQIEGILADKQRLINRTRIKRSTYRILGSLPKVQEEGAKQDEAFQEPDQKKTADDEFDFEIYDDDDFYHQLLRELIEKKTGDGGSNQIALGRQWLEIQKLRSKAKRKVDAKASKGRRLRYQVHPKLVSFMAPYPENSWNDIAKNELFASLFGSGTSVR